MKPQSDLHSVDKVPWTPIAAGASSAAGKGIVEKLLSVDPDNPHNCTRLVRLDKGVKTGVVTHPFWEEVYVIKGHMVDKTHGIDTKQGDFCCRHPGMVHGPFEILEEVITFEIHYVPKEWAEQ